MKARYCSSNWLLLPFVLAAPLCHAELYTIEVIQKSENENFASAISEEASVTNCFNQDCTAVTPKVASRGRVGGAGQWLNNEIEFLSDNRFRLTNELSSSAEYLNYCINNLGYENCETWANNVFKGTNGSGGTHRILNSYSSEVQFNASNNNSKSYVTGGVPLVSEVSGNIAGTNEIVVNNFDGDTAIGSSSSGYMHVGSASFARQYKSRGFYGTTVLEPIVTSQPIDSMGSTRAFDLFEYNGKKYVVGSSAFSIYGNEADCKTVSEPHTKLQCQNLTFNNQAVVWDVTNTGAVTISKVTDTLSGTQSSQASVRAATLDPNNANQPVLVGYYSRNDSSNLLPEAAIFLPTFDSSGEINGWNTQVIGNTQLNPSGFIYTHSLATDINQNLLVIGSSKRGNYDYQRNVADIPVQQGALNQRLWVADASSTYPAAKYLEGGIFFDGSGGDMRAVNDFNEIVGRVDFDTTPEVNGSKRTQRGFIYPYQVTGIVAHRGDIFNHRAWLLDDLTNNGDVSEYNNQFRIVDANDINNAGVISATALMCNGGYVSTSHNAKCETNTKLVAVKMTPISGSSFSDIQTRKVDIVTANESENESGANGGQDNGGSLGTYLFGVLLTLAIFRRYKNSTQ